MQGNTLPKCGASEIGHVNRHSIAWNVLQMEENVLCISTLEATGKSLVLCTTYSGWIGSHPFESSPCFAKSRRLYLLYLQALTTKQIEITSVAWNQTEGQRQLKINQASWKKSFAETVVSTA